MLTTAVVGPPLTEPPSELLIADALADTLRPHERHVRLLVPVTGESLTAGVLAVVEWAWKQEAVEVVAVYDNHLLFTDLERRFLDEGADSVMSVDDVAYSIGRELADADESCLVAALNDEAPDALTKRLVDLAFLSEVPVYDVSYAMIPVDPYDINGWDTAPAEAEEQHEEDAEVPAVVEEKAKMAVAEVPALDVKSDMLREMRRGWRLVERTAADWVRYIDDELEGREHPRQEKRDFRILISTDGGLTRHPRGRGKAPKGSIEYNAETGEVLRRH